MAATAPTHDELPTHALLRRSFALATREPERFAPRFYERLFTLAPAVRSLFPDDLRHQQQKLTQALVVLVRGLDQPQVLEPVLRQLGARHAGYGAQAGHYAVVGEALIETLDELAGEPMDAGTRAAWAGLYGWVAATMLAGAESVTARPPAPRSSAVTQPPR